MARPLDRRAGPRWQPGRERSTAATEQRPAAAPWARARCWVVVGNAGGAAVPPPPRPRRAVVTADARRRADPHQRGERRLVATTWAARRGPARRLVPGGVRPPRLPAGERRASQPSDAAPPERCER